ncbi:hypothetical protein EDC14_1004155 [Hydrogenispora ethanolica]|uniref:Uncharacterized protein n=1 Tax=Hydrogenispora ethanolica TaxID=1082276 RepID=A0A4V2QG28_HYDET|nr:hypothetical protein EDC14_1004155 [Hydrogenispora ethanolica]
METVILKILLVIGIIIWTGIELGKANRQANEIMSKSRRKIDGEQESSECRDAA